MSFISKEHELKPGEELPKMDTISVKSADPYIPVKPLYKSTQENHTVPRPKRNDPEVLSLFYKKFAVVMKKDCPNLCTEMSLQGIEAALKECGRPDSNGYEYAKQLERYAWDGIQADDVEVLDGASSVLRDAHNTIVAQWVKDNNIQPNFNDGDLCSYEGETGTVHWCARLMRTGEYLFRSVKWINEHGDQGGMHVDWEEVKA
ncbi:MAG: hypothetical protein ACXWT0_00400 [Methylobacter sp.]